MRSGQISHSGRVLPANVLQFAAVIVVLALASMHGPPIPFGTSHNTAHAPISGAHQTGAACIATHEGSPDIPVPGRSTTRVDWVAVSSVRCPISIEHSATPDQAVLSIWRQ